MRTYDPTGPVLEGLEPRLLLDGELLSNGGFETGVEPKFDSLYSASADDLNVWLASWANDISFIDPAPDAPQPIEGSRVAQVNRAGTQHVYMRMGQIVHAPGATEVTVRGSWFTHYFGEAGEITLAFGNQMPGTLNLGLPDLGMGEYIELAAMDNQTDAWESIDQVITLPGTYDYLAIRIDAGGWTDDPSGWADQYIAVDGFSLLGPDDTVAPSTVADLSTVSTGSSSVLLQWTAPGDDGPVGTADHYEIRTSTTGPITDATWDQATPANPPSAPLPAGSTETAVVSGLQPETQYWFALRAYDEAGNVGDVSNSVSAMTGVALVNLLANPDFETGSTSGWQTLGSVQVTGGSALSGSFGLRTVNSGVRQSLATQAGQRYKATAWLRIDDEVGSDWGGFVVEATDLSWQKLASSGYLTRKTLGQGWQEVGITFTATGSTTRLDVKYFGGAGRTMTVSVDDLMLFEAPASNSPPEIYSVNITPGDASKGDTQTFEVIADDPDGAIDRFLWEFGDGTRAFVSSGSRQMSVAGSFQGMVYVIDDEGAVGSHAFTWSVDNPAGPMVEVDPTPSQTGQATLTLSGTTGATVTALQISRDNRTLIDAAPGTWTVDVPLAPGNNRLLIQAMDADGRVATVERIVRYVPAAPLAVDNLTPASPSVEMWKAIELTFDLIGSAATHPHLPYVADPAEGMDWIDGVTVDAVFWLDGRPEETYTRPAFRYQDYDRRRVDGDEWLQPIGDPVWTVRFAPPEEGVWHCRIDVTEARGQAQSQTASFTALPVSDPDNHGPIVASADDSRYFEHADGTPFTVTGHNMSWDIEGYSYAAEDYLNTVGPDNQQLYRLWISGEIWSSPWQYWHSRTLEWGGNVPPPGLTVDAAYGDGLVACQLDAENPIMFQGWLGPRTPLTPGDTYVIRVRWRTEGVDQPANASNPYGLTIKRTGWPTPGATGGYPALVSHVHGDTPWHVSEGSFVATEDYLDEELSIILENSLGGVGWVDEVSLHRQLPDGSLGPNVLHDHAFNSHMVFDEARAYSLDQILAEAEGLNQHFTIVVGDKEDWILPHMGDEGLASTVGQSYYGSADSGKAALHAAYWRYLSARYNASQAVHSWELVNEGNPGSESMFRLATEMAQLNKADANGHLATTSSWWGINEEMWTRPEYDDLGLTNLHVYNYGTGWIEPKSEIHDDSARFYLEYAAALAAENLGKPSLLGEVGIDPAGEGSDDPLLAQDQSGVWLHKYTWAQAASYGAGALYWSTGNIIGKGLHSIYGAYRRFMEGIPLTNGRYVDAAASVSNSQLRAVGQKDLSTGWAHLWIDNSNHTWYDVVTGAYIPSLSGTVTVDMAQPDQAYTVTWYGTATGQATGSQTVWADGTGAVQLSVSSLATDTAVRLTRVDTAAPAVVDVSRDDGQAGPDSLTSLAVRFSEDVDAAVDLRDLEVTNLTTGEPVDVSGLIRSEFEYDTQTFTARWQLGFLNLPAGWYRLALPSGSVADWAGNVLDGDGNGLAGGAWQTSLLVASGGDANTDGLVDVSDLGILAGNWGLPSGATWATADFSHDGAVDVSDLGILSGNWQRDLTPPASAAIGGEQESASSPSLDATATSEQMDSTEPMTPAFEGGASITADATGGTIPIHVAASTAGLAEPATRPLPTWLLLDPADAEAPAEPTLDLLSLL